MPRPTPPSVTTILFCLRLAVFSAAAIAIAFTIDEIAGIAAENASTGGDGSSLGLPWHSSESASAAEEPEPQGDVHRQALHWDGGGESASSLVAVGTLFCIFCVGGLLSAVAFFIAARLVLLSLVRKRTFIPFSIPSYILNYILSSSNVSNKLFPWLRQALSGLLLRRTLPCAL